MGSNVGELSKTHEADGDSSGYPDIGLRSSDGSDKLEHQLSALLEVLAHIYGADKLVLKAGKLEALGLLKSQSLEDKVIALSTSILVLSERVIYLKSSSQLDTS
jgi:hypothetical protein